MILQAIRIQRFASERHRVAERPVLTLHHTVLGEVPSASSIPHVQGDPFCWIASSPRGSCT